MTDDDTSDSRTDVAGTDDRHSIKSWADLDYEAAARPSERRDTNTPTGIPDAVTGQTTFDPSDAARDARGHYIWLGKLNQGVGASDRDMQRQKAGVTRDLGVVAGQLGVTEFQRERAAWLLEQLSLKADVIPNDPVEVAVLAVVSLVVDEDRTRAARDEPDELDVGKKQSVLRDTAFARLLEEFDCRRRQVRQARHRVRETAVYTSPNHE